MHTNMLINIRVYSVLDGLRLGLGDLTWPKFNSVKYCNLTRKITILFKKIKFFYYIV